MTNKDSKFSFPNAPWKLSGKGIQALFLVKSSKIKNVIPKDFRVVNVLPGYTIGLISLGIYDDTGSLEYSELIVCPCFIKYKGKKGFYISDIHVDDSHSIQGGKEIWKIEKEMSEFRWNDQKSEVAVFHANHSFVEVKSNSWFRIPIPTLKLRAFNKSKEFLSSFVGSTTTKSKFSIVNIKKNKNLFFVPKKALGVYHLSGQLIANTPDIIETHNKNEQ